MKQIMIILICLYCQLSKGQNFSCPDFFTKCSKNLDELILNVPNTQCRYWNGACLNGTIYRSGKVSISSDGYVPSGYHLYVGGAVYASRARVKLSNEWCDYVFDDNYKLLSLDSINEFINHNKHLPNIPSQSDIQKEEGIELKSITIKQQEKIEEIYLYILEFNNRLNKLKEKMKKLEAENNKLKKN